MTSLLPSFKLGDAETTAQVRVKHLICACTGLPRQDLEWLLQYQGMTPDGALATVKPTSKFGEMFQYSNLLAGAGGFVGGHVSFPELELGAAYDEAMRTRVFEPLGMRATTFDYAKALASNHALPHSQDIEGRTALAVMDINYSVIPLRPAGAAWSSVRDLLAYVSAELAEGVLPDGKRYLERDTLLARRAPQVSIGKDTTYGIKLASRYTSDALGEIAVSRTAGATVFDFGEWKSEVASRKNPALEGILHHLRVAGSLRAPRSWPG